MIKSSTLESIVNHTSVFINRFVLVFVHYLVVVYVHKLVVLIVYTWGSDGMCMCWLEVNGLMGVVWGVQIWIVWSVHIEVCAVEDQAMHVVGSNQDNLGRIVRSHLQQETDGSISSSAGRETRQSQRPTEG